MPTRRKPPALDALITRARLAHEAIRRQDDAGALERAMDAGDALQAIKDSVPHGNWSAALAATGIPSSTARLYMQLARARVRLSAAGCSSIRDARTLLAGTKPRRPRAAHAQRGRPSPAEHYDPDRYQEGYADGYRAGRADGFLAGKAAGEAQPRANRGPVPTALDLKDMRWLITLAHPDKHSDDLRATRVTQWLNELVAHARAS